MGKMKDKIESYINQKRINNLSDKTSFIIAQICDPRVELQIETSQRVDEIYQKMQRLIELETNKKMQNIDRQLDNMNARFGIQPNQKSRNM